MSTQSETIYKQRHQPPNLLACIACRSRHLKCDAQTPACSRCSNRGLVCTYIESKRGLRGSRKDLLHTDATNTRSIKSFTTLSETGASSETNLDNTSYPSNVVNVTASSRGDSLNSRLDADLIDLFYHSFHPAHPFIPPRKLHLQAPELIPEPLKAVMRFVASHYQPNSPQDILQNAASTILSPEISIDPAFKIQGLLCLSISFLAGRGERSLGMTLLNETIDLALSAGLNGKSFVENRLPEHAILAESWRRTWWDLYIVDGLLSALEGSGHTSRLRHIPSDVPLPGHCDDYNDLLTTTPPPLSLSKMRDRAFSATSYPWSSSAYKIEATRIMGTVLSLPPDTFATTDSQVEALDASIQSYILSLPPRKREIVESGGKVDEVLFAAHMIIHWASITLHRPRSNLTFIRAHYRTACSPTSENSGFPAPGGYAGHTAKALRAASAISKLTAVQTPLPLHTPCFACAVALAATVLLPAYQVQVQQRNRQEAQATRERLLLGASALAAIAEVWPLAGVVRFQVAQFARETFGEGVGRGTAEETETDTESVEEGNRGGGGGGGGGGAATATPMELDFDAILSNDTWLDDLCADGGRMLEEDLASSTTSVVTTSMPEDVARERMSEALT